MSLGGEYDFPGKRRPPLPPKSSGEPYKWEEWSWTFNAYLSTFDAQAAAFMDQHELDPDEVTDGDLAMTAQDEIGTLVVDREAAASCVTFSRNLHYLVAKLTTKSARLTARPNCESNGFETWRRLVKK